MESLFSHFQSTTWLRFLTDTICHYDDCSWQSKFDLTRQRYFERMRSGTHALHLEIIVMLNFPVRGLYLQVSSELKTSVVCEEGNGNGKEKQPNINHISNMN